MSLLTAIEQEFAKARADVGAAIEFFTHKAEVVLQQEVAALKADEAKIAGDVKDALEKAKATALADVQANAPEAAALVSKAVSDIEAEVLAVITAHLVP
jgi:F0F1-type ATP synthase membrane subunit b/b'